ncbi:MAG: hypothetical protein AB7H71_07915 [Alphaproteobacteria bacterium]
MAARTARPKPVRHTLRHRVSAVAMSAALAVPLLGCASTDEQAAREAAEPDAVAAAVCREIGKDGDCAGMSLTDRGSEIAYAGCLDYNRRDPRACLRLRQAYEDDIRRQLGAAAPPVDRNSLSEKRRVLDGLEPRERYRTAEALYKAANSDSDTFQAALLIPEVRKKIEAALGKSLSDEQLRALIDHNRAEALYWYEYLRRLPPRETAER